MKQPFHFLILLFLGLSLGFHSTIKAQGEALDVLTQDWKAYWISVPDIDPQGYGVYYFRKSFELSTIPTTFPVHVSGDNRYKLYINNNLISTGPARSDLLHWNYETVDLAPFLVAGKNVVAAQVWNEGKETPLANVSAQTAFILMGGVEESQVVNTNSSWKCIEDKSYAPLPVKMRTYYVAGPGERVDMQQHIAAWNGTAYDDSQWGASRRVGIGYPKYRTGFGSPNDWMLVPSTLPQMEMKDERFHALRKAVGVEVPKTFPQKLTQIVFPANSESTLILDQSYLTNAYLNMRFSGGKESVITLDYAEALFTENYPEKGNRDAIEGKVFLGRSDQILPNGKENQSFTSLAFRTYRYVQVKVQTQAMPLVLNDIYGTFTGYPFQLNATLKTEDKTLQKIVEIGWRTARLCAFETYMDCPYYEQLQYVGDARIQALVSLYNSGDDRLVKNLIRQIDHSREAEGITMSRYPSAQSQYIPPFSLWYIGILYDYMMYGADLEFTQSKLLGVRSILDYFSRFQQEDGRVKQLPWWNFSDWVEEDPNWRIGVRSAGADGSSALIDLQLLGAYQAAAALEAALGIQELADRYQKEADRLKQSIHHSYWDARQNRYADNSEKTLFSQHTNALALLNGVAPEDKKALMGQQLLTATDLAPASIYFKYYLHQALTQAGYGEDYLKWLDKWKENIDMGMTTWSEDSNINTTRSDCHAWGSSPNIEFFRIVLGIDSAAPGFAKVKVEPHLGTLTAIGGQMPHPKGEIQVHYERKAGKWSALIVLPETISGDFIWKGKTHVLNAGENRFSL